MRRLVWILGVLAVLWSGWWWLAATMVERGVAGWLDAQRAQGWQAEVGALSVSGFPLTVAAAAQGLSLADPASGRGVAAEQIDISAPAYWPGDVTLRLPQTPVRLSGPLGEVALVAQAAVAQVNLHPGVALELEMLQAVSGPWALRAREGALLGAESLMAEVLQDADAPAAYHVTLEVADFAPGDLVRAALALPDDWPRRFDALAVDATVRFDRPLDRFSGDGSPPQPREVELRGVDLGWGALRVHAEGVVSIDAAGLPDGTLALTVENWPQVMDQAQVMGVVTGVQRRRAELVLNALGNLGGSRENLDLDLRFEGGEAFLGPIPLGPAPRVVWP